MRESAVRDALDQPLARSSAACCSCASASAARWPTRCPQIAKELGITANRARLIESTALERLQSLPEGRALESAA